jgi:hypothetical protein
MVFLPCYFPLYWHVAVLEVFLLIAVPSGTQAGQFG